MAETKIKPSVCGLCQKVHWTYEGHVWPDDVVTRNQGVTKKVVTEVVTPCQECVRLRARIAELEKVSVGVPSNEIEAPKRSGRVKRDRAEYMRNYRKGDV